jgi:DNA-binding IclR family transcriptional regulator
MKQPALTSPEYRIRTVEKAFEAIELLSDTSSDNNSIVAVAEKLGLSRNKTLRILRTLTELGIAEKDLERGTYHLGITAFELARKLLRPASVINNAHPVIEELALKHQEDVYLTVLCDKDVLFLDMANCKQQVKTIPLLGNRYPLFTTAAGKVMAAMGVSLDLVGTLIRKGRRSESSLSIEQLEHEFSQIRSNGVAVDENSLGEGVVSIAVPFKDYAGKVLGAITLLGPSFRLLSERVEKEIIPSMLEYAELLSCRFGYSPA